LQDLRQAQASLQPIKHADVHDRMEAEKMASDQNASGQLLMIPLETECRNRIESSDDR
jgi:hypothetical protein